MANAHRVTVLLVAAALWWSTDIADAQAGRPLAPEAAPRLILLAEPLPKVRGLKMHDSLVALATAAAENRPAAEVAQRFMLRMPTRDTVRVQITDSHRGNLRRALADMGAIVEVDRPEGVQAVVPVLALQSLATRPYVTLVEPPHEIVESVGDYTSEGVAKTDADDWHNHATYPYNGTGIKVCILDQGFANYTTYQGSNDLPPSSRLTTQNFRSDGNFTSTVHGSGCAEVVYDMAYGCHEYLVATSTYLEVYNALDWLENDGSGNPRVDVISMSIGWYNANFYDSTQAVATNLHDTVSKGVFIAVAAGNQAQRHYGGNFNPDANGYHVWPTGGNHGPLTSNTAGWYSIPANTPLRAYLTWNAWPTTDQDFDLYLLRTSDGSSFTVVASSTTEQNGDDPPTEALAYTTTGTYWYTLLIARYSASTTPKMHVHVSGAYMHPTNMVAATSIVNPADCQNVFTVGATYHSNDSLEVFSSRGPREGTGDSYKPNATAPDGVSCRAYGAGAFYGTSAATPHVAGAAALYLDQNEARTPAQLKWCIEAEALDLGAAGYDNSYGAGRLKMPLEGSNFAGGSPLGTIITDLRATCTAAGRLITWDTRAGARVAGYKVLRARHASGPWECLNQNLIAPGPGRMVYWDRAGPEAGAWYAVQAIGLRGQEDEWATCELRADPLGVFMATRELLR